MKFDRSFKLALGFISLVLLSILIVRQQSNYYKSMNNKFPFLSIQDRINDNILEITKIKGVSYVSTKGKRSFGIGTCQNYDYDNEYIHNNISAGDSIVKRSGSDTIFIYERRGGVKYFVLDKVINKPKR